MSMPVPTPPLSPPQLRAARALLGWSQEELATRARVGLSTVRALEKERRGGEIASLKPIRDALTGAGIVFLYSSGDMGPGVRLRADLPTVLRWPVKLGRFGELLIPVEWRGKEYDIFVPREILDDMGRMNSSPDETVYIRLYEKFRNHILAAAAKAIDERGAGPDRRTYLVHDDFPPELV